MSNSPYCKTCHKAGKSYSEYTNHWTRDKPGKYGNIICPVILNTVCTYCKEKGHWVKYCPNLPKKQYSIETHNQPTTQTLNSWANILKRGLPLPSQHKRNINFHIEYDTNIKAAGSMKGFDYTNSMNVDVSVCELDQITRPPSPDYPPPSSPNYRPQSPDYPPPSIDYSSTLP